MKWVQALAEVEDLQDKPLAYSSSDEERNCDEENDDDDEEESSDDDVATAAMANKFAALGGDD